jgi:hypothetical protein
MEREQQEVFKPLHSQNVIDPLPTVVHV